MKNPVGIEKEWANSDYNISSSNLLNWFSRFSLGFANPQIPAALRHTINNGTMAGFNVTNWLAVGVLVGQTQFSLLRRSFRLHRGNV